MCRRWLCRACRSCMPPTGLPDAFGKIHILRSGLVDCCSIRRCSGQDLVGYSARGCCTTSNSTAHYQTRWATRCPIARFISPVSHPLRLHRGSASSVLLPDIFIQYLLFVFRSKMCLCPTDEHTDQDEFGAAAGGHRGRRSCLQHHLSCQRRSRQRRGTHIAQLLSKACNSNFAD